MRGRSVVFYVYLLERTKDQAADGIGIVDRGQSDCDGCVHDANLPKYTGHKASHLSAIGCGECWWVALTEQTPD